MKQVLGGILLAVGILIAGASGVCSLAALAGSLSPLNFSYIPMVLVFGGIPFGIGVAIAFGGRALIRSGNRGYGDN